MDDYKLTIKDLETWSPDTIAETFDNVSKELYLHLWNVVVPSYEQDKLILPQDFDSKFYQAFEPNSIGWLKYVDMKFKNELQLIANSL